MAFLNYLKILKSLVDHEVEFIVVGGISAALNGAPIDTLDVDVVHSTAPENVRKLLSALQELDAYYRIQPERRFRPNESHLSCPGHQLLMTKFGPLDLLGSVTKQRTYADLLPDAREMAVGPDVSAKVLGIEMLITLKEEAGRDKDLSALPILRNTLDEIRRQENEKRARTTPECG